MTTHLLPVEVRDAGTTALRALPLAARAEPARSAGGLTARAWVAEGRTLCGRYLFSTKEAAHAFRAAPDDCDPEVTRWVKDGIVDRLDWGESRPLPPVAFVRPTFIISAPRAGSTVLFDLLARGADLWTLGAESHGVIEGIPALHPRARHYASHQLGAEDATGHVALAVRAGLVAGLRDCWSRSYLGRPERDRPPGPRLLEKTPENALRIPFLHAAFPDARFIFLHREARASISSIIEAWRHEGFVSVPHLPGWSRGAWHLTLPPGWDRLADASLAKIAAYQWQVSNDVALDALGQLPAGDWCGVEFDELLTDPAAVVERLCAFLQIRFDPHLAKAVSRELPASPTMISPPSPAKWRFNQEFDETVIEGLRSTEARLAALRPSARTPRRRERIKRATSYACFLEDCVGPGSGPDSDHEDSADGIIVDPSYVLQRGSSIPFELTKRPRFRERFCASGPILWIQDPATSAIYPFWLRRGPLETLSRLEPGGHPVGSIEPGLWSRLVEAGILTREHTWVDRRRYGHELRRTAGERFRDEGYCLLPRVVHRAHLVALARYYRTLIATGEWKLGDDQVGGRYGWHNEWIARYFHHQFVQFIGDVAGRRLKPSYTYVSAYQGGAVLERHRDREQCEFTVSVLVDETPPDAPEPWPLFLDTPKGTASVTQQPGDAILFRGSDLPHYRDRLPDGRTYTCMLFHYVPQEFRGTLY